MLTTISSLGLSRRWGLRPRPTPSEVPALIRSPASSGLRGGDAFNFASANAITLFKIAALPRQQHVLLGVALVFRNRNDVIELDAVPPAFGCRVLSVIFGRAKE